MSIFSTQRMPCNVVFQNGHKPSVLQWTALLSYVFLTFQLLHKLRIRQVDFKITGCSFFQSITILGQRKNLPHISHIYDYGAKRTPRALVLQSRDLWGGR